MAREKAADLDEERIAFIYSISLVVIVSRAPISTSDLYLHGIQSTEYPVAKSC